MQHFCDNYAQILIILSLMLSEMNFRRSWNKICHVTLNLFPHYLSKTFAFSGTAVHSY